MTTRKYVAPGSRVPFRLSERERDLVLAMAYLDPDIEARLREAVSAGPGFVAELTLDDIDELAGSVAAEANHCDEARRRSGLDRIFDRLTILEDRYTDAPPPARVATPRLIGRIVPTKTARRQKRPSSGS